MAGHEPLPSVTFTTKGQVVISRRIRQLFEIEAGTRATVETTDKGILVRKGRGMLAKGKKPLVQEWAEHKAEERTLEEGNRGRIRSR